MNSDALVQLVKALATPVATLVVLYWFKDEINKVLQAVEYIIRERRIRTTFPGGSLEVGSAAREELQNVQKEIGATPMPPNATSSVPDLIEARRFIVRDESGRARVEIGTGIIRLFNGAGEVKVGVVCTEDGLAGVKVTSGDGASIGILAVSGGSPLLGMAGADEKLGASLTNSVLELADGRVALAELPDLPPMIWLRDKEGKELFRAP